jgi:hypothetical protein
MDTVKKKIDLNFLTCFLKSRTRRVVQSEVRARTPDPSIQSRTRYVAKARHGNRAEASIELISVHGNETRAVGIGALLPALSRRYHRLLPAPAHSVQSHTHTHTQSCICVQVYPELASTMKLRARFSGCCNRLLPHSHVRSSSRRMLERIF